MSLAPPPQHFVRLLGMSHVIDANVIHTSFIRTVVVFRLRCQLPCQPPTAADALMKNRLKGPPHGHVLLTGLSSAARRPRTTGTADVRGRHQTGTPHGKRRCSGAIPATRCK